MRRAPARPVRACFARQRCTVPKVPLETPHSTLHSSHCTLHTSHFALTLHTPHFISSHLSSSHLISALLISSHLISSHMSSKFFSTTFISFEHCSTFLISSRLFSTHLCSSARQKAFTVREKRLRTESFCAQKNETQMRLHRKAFTHRKLLHMRRFSTQHTFPRKFRSQTSDNTDR